MELFIEISILEGLIGIEKYIDNPLVIISTIYASECFECLIGGTVLTEEYDCIFGRECDPFDDSPIFFALLLYL